jgi:hypothetical protein
MTVFKKTSIQKIHPTLIERMETIVKEIVVQSKFHSDFYKNDLKAMDTCSAFAWYVYDCGTHFVPLNDMNAVRTFQQEWISNMKDVNDSKKSRDTYRLYVCDIYSGDLKRVYGFEEGNLTEQLKTVV